MSECSVCHTPETDDPETELRPYGPGGSLICFDCAFATPEMAKAVEQNFFTVLDAAAAMSPDGTVIIGGKRGPEPYNG